MLVRHHHIWTLKNSIKKKTFMDFFGIQLYLLLPGYSFDKSRSWFANKLIHAREDKTNSKTLNIGKYLNFLVVLKTFQIKLSVTTRFTDTNPLHLT